MFFDLKKGNDVIADTSAEVTTVNRKATCCTPVAEATCYDWSTVNTCAAGTFDAGHMVDLAPDSEDGMTVSDAAYKETCCVAPTTCAAAVDELNSSFKSTVSMVVLLGGLALQL